MTRAHPISRFFLLAAAVLAVQGARAQIEVACRLDPEIALQFEPVHAVVTLKNNTGTDISFFGDQPTAGLDFLITNGKGAQVPSREGLPAREAIMLGPGERAVITNLITMAYDLRPIDSYAVQARASWNGRAFVHEMKRYLDVVAGLELEKAAAAVAGGTSHRLYSLRTVHRSRAEHLLLRIDDETAGMCYGVYDLGSFVRRMEPALQVDAAGYVHVLFQSAPTRYLHRAFAPDGTGAEPVSYLDESGQIHFDVTEDGRVEVVGASPEEVIEE
jgi:hypothetical protein